MERNRSSPIEPDEDGGWRTVEQGLKAKKIAGEMNKAIADLEDEELYAENPGEQDVVEAIKMSRVIANIHQCYDCRHLHANEITCKAYPKGIPSRILSGEFDHILAYAGDGGINWRPKQ